MVLTNTFFIETYGCTSNKADSLIIANALRNSNYIEAPIDNAEFVIINTCAVKEQTENKIKARLRELYELYGKNSDKYLIIAGCLPHITSSSIDVIKKLIPTFSAILDLDIIHKIPEILIKIKKGKNNLVFNTSETIDKSKFLIEHTSERITGIVPISEGCKGSCTYCCVKNARGRLICYNPQNIVKNVEYQLKQGIKQIYLTSQDCSIYNYDETNLLNLVESILKLKFKFFLRIGMINPSFLINNLQQLIKIFKFKKAYQFLHIPIQSGSNTVLKRMKRTYLISDIVEPIDILRKEFPSLTISTDIICGFPSESEYDFYRTINLVKWLKPEILNISKFTGRPGTEAKKMKQLNSRLIKERSIRLSRVFRNSLLTINEKWKGWEGEVLVLHKGAEKNQAFGRNYAYKNIFIDDFTDDFGKFVNVKIYKVDGFNLFGKIIK